MMKTSRREFLGAALALPAVAIPSIALGSWPHHEVGMIPTHNLDYGVSWAVDWPPDSVFVGAWVEGGRVIDPGRVYTPEEWERVGPDVERFLAQRMAIIDP